MGGRGGGVGRVVHYEPSHRKESYEKNQSEILGGIRDSGAVILKLMRNTLLLK